MNTKPLIIGLGNELLGDDGIGIAAVRKLRADNTVCADIVDCNLSGVSLIDILSGYSKVIFIDAIKTREYVPGTVLELDIGGFRPVPSDSPHHTGLPELINLSRRLGIEFPDKIVIYAVEVEECSILGSGLSDSVTNALGPLLDKVRLQLRIWNEDNAANSSSGRQTTVSSEANVRDGQKIRGANNSR